MRGLFKAKSIIKSEHINMGHQVTDIPVARITGSAPGQSLLITAGLDGDEYAGMKAAYALIEEFSYTSFNGSLIIIPVVNIPGFEAQTSENPMDGKYPKHIYPGKKDGSPTEQLCYWLHMIATGCDLWLDMHGGALTEIITPFVGSYISGNKTIDTRVLDIIKKLPCGYATVQRPAYTTKAKTLSKYDCGYIMTESGQGSDNGKAPVERHMLWTHVIMGRLGMIPYPTKEYPKTIYSRVDEYRSTQNGIWHPQFTAARPVEKGELLGSVASFEGFLRQQIVARHAGVLLWARTGMGIRKGDSAAGVGYAESHSY